MTKAATPRAPRRAKPAQDAAPPRGVQPVHIPPEGGLPPEDVWKIPVPVPGTLPRGMAMDACVPAEAQGQAMAWAMASRWHEGLAFMGFPYLAELAQRPEYRKFAEKIAKNMTRKWIALQGPDEDRVKQLEAAMLKHGIRDKFRHVAELDCFFGRAQIHIDMGQSDLNSRLTISPATIGKGRLRGFKVVEPMWTYPGMYEATNPLHPDFYRPRHWYCMGQTIDASRLLTFVGRDVPDMLKPVYGFGGLSMSQMAKPYVDNWLRTRQSVSDLLHSFSLIVLGTDLSTILAGGGAQTVLNRVQMFNQFRDNRGTMVVDKDTETLENIAVPLGTLDALQAQAQEHLAAVSGIPLVELLGVTPSGLNASSDGEVRTFYAEIKSAQERLFGPHLKTVLDILQLDLWGAVDPAITFVFIDLWEMDETAKAAIRKSDSEADIGYVNAGVVSPDEARERLSKDESGAYFGIDLSGPAPEAPDDADVLGLGEGEPGGQSLLETPEG